METQTATAAGAATKPASFIPEAPGAAGQPHLCPPPGEGGVRKGREDPRARPLGKGVLIGPKRRGGGREGEADSVLPCPAV